MANAEQLEILKQGVEVWNRWRGNTFGALIDFTGADLMQVDLSSVSLGEANSIDIEDFPFPYPIDAVNIKTTKDANIRVEWAALLEEADFNGANLKQANLREAHLRRANLTGADLSEANLRGADLRGANLTEADLSEANLEAADLSGANLSKVNLSEAELNMARLNEADLREAKLSFAGLRMADLSGTNLSEANLAGVDLIQANLIGSNFFKAHVGNTIFGNSDLSQVLALDDVVHHAPSRISTDTFILSKGKIPEVFLRGCGLSDWEIEEVKLYNPDLSNDEVNKILYRMYELRATQALQISPLFISYSHADREFVDSIGNHLTEKGIRYWRDIHDAKAGRLEKQIDRAIRQNPTVLLILSSNSIKSDWVEHEVRTARTLEKEIGRDILCPVALDDSWKTSPWPKRVMEQVREYNILDFSAWKDDSKFDDMFRKLIDGLGLFYKA